jgi:hypothetical protein
LPATYHIDRTRQLVLSRAWGVLSNEDLEDHYAWMTADPAFDPEFRQLADLREVTELALNSSNIARAATKPAFDAQARRAIVANSDIAFGLSRMYAIYAEGRGQTVEVFRTIEEAEAWLGLTPAAP